MKQQQQQQQQRNKDEWDKRSERWVLVVDDEESIRSYVGQYLFHSGYQVTLCNDGLSALQMTRNFTNVMAELQTTRATTRPIDITSIHSSHTDGIHPPPIIPKTCPDAIVTDIRMPGPLDGLDLLREIRADERLKGIPVILLTAKGRTEDRVVGYDNGADVYLPKPFDPDELVAILDNVIDRNQLLSGTTNDGLNRVSLQDLQEDVKEIKTLLRDKYNNIVDPSIQNRNSDSSLSGLVPTTRRSSIMNGNISLTSDERAVLELLCQGLTNKEMAQQLNYSVRRVEQHLTSMFRKTGCTNRTELVRLAFDTKMVDL
jgi:DNA-binding NarL/FixJ family response regulator